MHASLLVFSQTGNTRKTGAAIAAGLAAAGFSVDTVGFLQRERWRPAAADLVGVGCPVFSNRPAEVVPRFFDEREVDLSGKPAFVFVTSGGSPARSLWHLARALERRGARVVGGLQLRGTSTFPTLYGLYPGRPDAGELARAETFGSAVAAHVAAGAALPAEFHVDPARGGRFYDTLGPVLNDLQRKGVPVPACVSDKCDLCGNCVFECPSKNITVVNKTIQIADDCIYCYRCWQVCPNDAIVAKFSPGNGFFDRIVYSEAVERWFGDVKAGEHAGENLYRDALDRRVRLKYDRKNPTGEIIREPKAK